MTADKDEQAVYRHFMKLVKAIQEPVFLTRQLVVRQPDEKPIRVRYHRSREDSAYMIGDMGTFRRRPTIDRLLCTLKHCAADNGVQTKAIAFYLYALAFQRDLRNGQTRMDDMSIEDVNSKAHAYFQTADWKPLMGMNPIRPGVPRVVLFRQFSQFLERRLWRFETACETKKRFRSDCIGQYYRLALLRAATVPLIGMTYAMIRGNVRALQLMDIIASKDCCDAVDAFVELSEHVNQCLYEQAKAHFDGQVDAGNVNVVGALEDRN